MGRRAALAALLPAGNAAARAGRRARWPRHAVPWGRSQRRCVQPARPPDCRHSPAPESAVRPGLDLQSRAPAAGSVMQTHLADRFKNSAYGQQAQEILRACVHCGFCNATCPTYRLLGDELDGPRGRIYLIKQVLEGKPATERTQQHLDRCLTCRNCETTCPSGVQYGRLIDIGRALVEQQGVRKVADRSVRSALREGLTGSWFAPTLKLGQAFRNWLPRPVRNSVPEPVEAGYWPVRRHPRRMLLLAGCVQPALRPSINSATARVLDAVGIELQVVSGAGCCGAIRHHLADSEG